jgi:hypothetical protein
MLPLHYKFEIIKTSVKLVHNQFVEWLYVDKCLNTI